MNTRTHNVGFVELHSPGDVQTAIATLNGLELDGSIITVDVHTGGKKGEKPSTVYVGNIARETRGWKLKEFFSTAGINTKSVDIIGDKGGGKGKGKLNFANLLLGGYGAWGKGGRGKAGGFKTGFVAFGNPLQAKNAIRMLNGSQLDDNVLTVDTWGSKQSSPSPYGKGQGKDPACKVYVGNINNRTRGWKLKEHFQQAGEVKSAEIHGEGFGKGW
eukprot:TRINITY_DN4894_c0_g1_i1.p1 TRINITY_DN4894_c0_g1~~TRINITY_DN4894_c0_g1_i1.p1  ORF type:complete len:216 (+),score=48.33 TRINITY_DN4894_c0_g1_i1:61-708(+)